MNWLAMLPIINVKTIAGIFAILQAVLKAVKEILTVLINSALPFIPNKKVQKIRDVINKIDAGVEKVKNFFLGMVK